MGEDKERDDTTEEESLARANRLLREALRALDEGRMVAAGNYARTAKKVGIASISRYKSAVEALIATRNTLNRARDRGIDITRAEEYFSQARASLRANKFSDVMKFCRLAFLACQPEPEPGRDYVIRTHFRRVEDEGGEIRYVYEVGIANVTDAPIEKLNVVIPDDIDRLFMAKETEDSINLEGKGSRVLNFVMEPVEGLEEIEGFIVGRDLEVKTILSAEGKNLVYKIRVNNISDAVIPSLTIAPPVMEGYVPDPGEISLENIYPLEGSSASFELVPEYSAPIVTPATGKEKEAEKPPSLAPERREWDVAKAAEEFEAPSPVGEGAPEAVPEKETPAPGFSEEIPPPVFAEETTSDIEQEIPRPLFELEEEVPQLTPLPPDVESLEGEDAGEEEKPELNFDVEENWVPPWDRIEDMDWTPGSREKEGDKAVSESDAELEFAIRGSTQDSEEDDMEEIDDQDQEGGN